MKSKIIWLITVSNHYDNSSIQQELKILSTFSLQGCIIKIGAGEKITQATNVYYLTMQSLTVQLNYLYQHFPPQAIKINLTEELLNIIDLEHYLCHYQGKIVVDLEPVRFTHCSQKKLFSILPYIDTVILNLPQVEQLLNCCITCYQDIESAAKALLLYGVKNAVITPAALGHTIFSQDYWANSSQAFWLNHKKITYQKQNTTATFLSSAIAACLALDYDSKDALVIAKMSVNRASRLVATKGEDFYLQLTMTWPEQQCDLPYVSHYPLQQDEQFFHYFPVASMGLYPIVDSVNWLKKLLPLGIKIIQLRIKNKKIAELEQEIYQAIKLANRYQAKLIINDYWWLAIRYQAYGVHLGQNDLNNADIEKIGQAGLYLGISTHCYYEVARAHSMKPSYIACGPIFATTSKAMPFLPQGIEQLKRWRRTLNYPLVAIGGINSSNLIKVLETKVQAVAMISALTQATNAMEATKKMLTLVKKYVTHS